MKISPEGPFQSCLTALKFALTSVLAAAAMLGMPQAQARGQWKSSDALASAYGIVLRQSMLLSFLDNFRLLAFMCLLCIPATLLFKRVRARGGPSMGAH